MGAAATIIIPARLASSRFAEKMLAAVTGMPLVQHVVEAARGARCASQVVVAADDERIAAALKPFGTRVLLTSVDHLNGTSRLAEAAALLGLGDEEIVVNAQGDEPEMDPAVLDAACSALVASTRAQVATAAAELASDEEAVNPNVVKVVCDLSGHALYFSRSRIPFDRDGKRAEASRPLRHIGVYVYRVAFLRQYALMASTPMERAEQLEQLRVLEHGHAIAVARVTAGHAGIDTAEQYAAFVERWRERGGR